MLQPSQRHQAWPVSASSTLPSRCDCCSCQAIPRCGPIRIGAFSGRRLPSRTRHTVSNHPSCGNENCTVHRAVTHHVPSRGARWACRATRLSRCRAPRQSETRRLFIRHGQVWADGGRVFSSSQGCLILDARATYWSLALRLGTSPWEKDCPSQSTPGTAPALGPSCSRPPGCSVRAWASRYCLQ